MTTESISPSLAALNQRYEPVPGNAGSNSNTAAEFQQVLSTLLMSQLGNPLGGGDDPSSTTGNDSLNSLMTLMMSQLGNGGGGITQLMDQLNSGSNPYGLVNQMNSVALWTAKPGQCPADLACPGAGAADQPVRGGQRNGRRRRQFQLRPDCPGHGIARIGSLLQGRSDAQSNGAQVDLARRMMVSDDARDGLDARGNRAENELNYYTDFDDLARGVQAAGGTSRMIGEDTASIRSALLSGARVIVSGTFAGKSPLPWTGDRGPDNHSAPGGATKHIITVSGYNARTNSFIINDPARLKPIEVSAGQLESFMEGNAGAMAIVRA